MHACAWAYLCVTIVNPLSHKLINAASHALTRVNACKRVHTCVYKCACLLCRSGDQMSSPGSYIRMSAALWFRSRVESSENSAEDFHLSIPNKSIKQQSEVICEMKHFNLQIVISCLFCWQQICLKSRICKKLRYFCTICSDFKLASFTLFHSKNLRPESVSKCISVSVESICLRCLCVPVLSESLRRYFVGYSFQILKL